MKVSLKNDLGKVKQVKVGFSWTMLFFGFLVPIIRGDFKYAMLTVIAPALTCGVS